jgi:AraC family transcriptional regulator, regulatory protein of adaptative response / methylated-DNA-[protein]-cysteine methyltransferase
MELFNEDVLYNALIDKDPSFEGFFYVGVTTTGIFCRPTCTARKPKRENVLFFRTPQEAMLNGFRECKVCRPLESLTSPPDWVMSLLDEIERSSDTKINDEALRTRGLDPARVRRWFKKEYGVTFQSYQRMGRLSKAFQEINEGASVTEVAFESGFDSLSGFSDSFKSLFDASPTKARSTQAIYISRLSTPLGPMMVGASDKGVMLLEFTDRRMLETELQQLKKSLKATLLVARHPHIEQMHTELSEYFAGSRRAFSVQLDTPGSDFQQRVWTLLRDIPYGETRSYKQQAELLDSPLAIRAVARANGMNRIAIAIPCHRVIASDGSLQGYAGGLARKKWLLDHERKHK